MPIYFCTTTEGQLTADQKAQIAETITTIYNEETGAPRYLVQVIFNGIAPGNHFIGGKGASEDQIWVRCDTRSGKTLTEKNKMMVRIVDDVAKICDIEQNAVSVLLNETPFSNITEFGRIAPNAGDEAAWFSSLPATLQERLKALS